ncbi:MAG: AAA family ATPase [Chloroflexi bacterium]|nr:AAA family ATPase [Chloroflexota bacterium]
MAKLVIVVGLPGSGKTFNLPRFKKEHNAEYLRDSFKKNAFHDSGWITNSRHYVDLISQLRNGNNCIIADIDFCREEAREEAMAAIQYHVPGVEVQWICFENNPDQCRKNVISSKRAVEGRLPRIEEFTKLYTYPPEALLIPVGDGSGSAPVPIGIEGLDEEDE